MRVIPKKGILSWGGNDGAWMSFPIIDKDESSYFIQHLDGKVAMRKTDCELLYTESEYNALKQDCLMNKEDVQELMRERDELLRTIEKAMDGQKVPLPRAVADVITALRNEFWENLQIIRNAVNESNDTTERSLVLRWYARGNFEKLMSALVNGYTIEETFEDRLQSGILKIIESHRNALAIIAMETSNAQMAEGIASFVRNEYANKHA